jgi:3-oxoadipate enol-lactonase
VLSGPEGSVSRVWERERVVGNSITISYLVGGQPGALVVVLVHGGGLDADAWTNVLDGLAENYRVYAPEMRGHGQSSWTPTYSFVRFAEDLNSFVETLGLSKVALVGHSIGGAATMLVLEEPTILRPGLPRLEVPPRPEGPLGFDWDGIVPALFAEANDPDPAWWDRLGEIEVPTLMLVGADEPSPKQQRMIEAAGQIPDARVETIPVGHGIHHAAPERFLQTLNAFIRQ